MVRSVAEMGEIRVEVRLTNAVDEALAYRESIADNEVRSEVADAMVDTGAVRTVIPESLARRLGVRVRREERAELADGRSVDVGLTEAILIEVAGRETIDEAFVLGNEVLIGQTVLEKLDLLADCANQRLVPNPDHPDQPVTKIKHS